MNAPPPVDPPMGIYRRLLTAGLAGCGIALVLYLDSVFMAHTDIPKLNAGIHVGLLLLVGFLTSFHCVGMCGPLILSYIAKNAKAGQHSHTAHLLYGVGKTVSYTAIGALFGGLGAFVAFTPFAQGIIGMAAGAFLLIFGLHMLEIYPALSHFQIKTPVFLMRFIGYEYHKHSNPLVIGLLNGLMIICGPLQAMYVLAAGSGNWLQGGAILLWFGLGTLPLLLGFGFLTTLLSTSLSSRLLKASGVIVMALGIIMFNRGLTITGSGMDFHTLLTRLSTFTASAPDSINAIGPPNEQTIHMAVVNNGFEPSTFTLRKGIPVKWVIDAKEINTCNKAIVVPEYNLKIEFKPGIQIIEFTPHKAGVVTWSCWMGMIPGSFTVVEETPATEQHPGFGKQIDLGVHAAKHLALLITGYWQRVTDYFGQYAK